VAGTHPSEESGLLRSEEAAARAYNAGASAVFGELAILNDLVTIAVAGSAPEWGVTGSPAFGPPFDRCMVPAPFSTVR
jgi:hypothetical protein